MSKYLDGAGLRYTWNKTKAYVEEKVAAVEGKVTSIYHWKGSVDDLEALKALPEDGLEIGDVYDVKSTGMNYAWTGKKEDPAYEDGWDPMGGIIEIPTLTTEEIDKLLLED